MNAVHPDSEPAQTSHGAECTVMLHLQNQHGHGCVAQFHGVLRRGWHSKRHVAVRTDLARDVDVVEVAENEIEIAKLPLLRR